MKKHVLLALLFLFSFSRIIAQSGTIGDPFTTLLQALDVPAAGEYYFDLNGTTFSTHVDENGYVLIAVDYGNGTGLLPQSSNLDLANRGILDPTTLLSITAQKEVRISSSTGSLDVISTNATILSRITSNTTLHTGVADNAINDEWTGTGASNFTNNASSTSPTENTLHRKIFHPSGNVSTFHWQPRKDQQRELFSTGEIADGESLRLWVRDNATILPIQLMNFNLTPDYNQVQISWQTASETNNDFFTIERSTNTQHWEEIASLEGAGNSFSVLSYTAYDDNPLPGITYYRLKQTDYDGTYSYSEIKSAINNSDNAEGLNNIDVYPNPTQGKVTVVGNSLDYRQVKIYDNQGQDVTNEVSLVASNTSNLTLDLSGLNQGIYIILANTTVRKIYKQ